MIGEDNEGGVLVETLVNFPDKAVQPLVEIEKCGTVDGIPVLPEFPEEVMEPVRPHDMELEEIPILFVHQLK